MFPWNNNQFPFDQSGFMKHLNKMNPKDVESYIQNVMKNVFSGDFTQGFPFQGNMTGNETSGFPFQGDVSKSETQMKPQPEIFETNDFVYVKLPLSSKDNKNLKLQHTNHQLILINYPKENEQSKYMLPSPVKRKGTRARFLDDYLEIQFIRLDESNISEIDISY
ncbi:Hsp20/alpha crystallin family protein [Metabacillus endolithicus]|uniref:Hsp20/alpha crystallin family protein n=1 Tax=Metabacillus endolithicus TaxID=1535204 RepID=A0ABW5BZK9_9BACI|nr:Hsp20/alpha crystallin family protein [Metabacillus endolithicus]UPG64176.1 Hsp20/alpha crystallin family protein [Metabacillus endolithicus]